DVQVDINPITIAFSKVMDTSSTQGAISSTPAISYTTSWTNEDKTLNLNPDDYLDYCEEYKVTISDDATDTAGVRLDGDEDGEPGGTYTFFFTTQTPPLSLNIDPSIYHFELEELGNCESKSGNVIINGSNLLKEVSCKLSKTVDGNGLSFSGGEGTFTISAGGSQNTDFTVTGCEEGGISVKLKATSPNDTRKTYATTAGGYSASIKEKNDHPDENQSPGPTVYPTPFILKSDSAYSSENVGIFIYGWTIGYAHILGEYGIPIIPIFSDFTYWKNPDTTLSDVVTLVVIGSGALSGFNSSQFAQKLADYVQSGGNLLVLTQKFGNDFSVLPGVVEGYGWREDQSCFRNAAYLNQWHPVFSGQTEQVMTCNVDGYITQCPDYADVLLRRTANGMPALLSYSYGAGRVIVSSLYPDWGYGHNQTSTEELRLLRDITTWALNPDMPIPEFYPDSNVSISVKINYFADDTVEATTAIIKVFTPDRVLYDSIAVPVSLQPGDEIQWDWNESSLPQNLGLWIIDYALMDGSSEEIQSFERGAIFAQRVDVPVGDYNLGDFLMWVNSDYEEVIAGDTVNYEVYIRNNTDSFFSGKVIVGVNHGTHVVDSITDLSIPSDTVIKILYQNPQWQSCLGGLWFSLYASDDTSGKYIARCERKAREIFHPFRVSLSKDKNPYLMGYDTVHYIAELDNEGNYPCSVKIEIYTVLDSIRYDVEIDTLNLSPSGAILEGGFFPWDYDSTAIGKGYLYCNLFYKDSLRNSQKTLYNLTYPNVQCSLSLPD
ncbi:Ig-like domain-containing protein, partial [candidate division WOR-3 bacterium]|nr:Ig-like domain-containing protein [candidate division WOR-3 bacterium]